MTFTRSMAIPCLLPYDPVLLLVVALVREIPAGGESPPIHFHHKEPRK
jgi:hypothetical protein